ncbi:transferase [Streptomyces naganishii JCM 4654]|uniref:Transferase n=2 Tax=Streptomyces naganishii TaxID=285447 RepID=A0A918Y4Z0_9ACTN|nr:transferase [Streptomyces naganishii JCM 4654]
MTAPARLPKRPAPGSPARLRVHEPGEGPAGEGPVGEGGTRPAGAVSGGTGRLPAPPGGPHVLPDRTSAVTGGRADGGRADGRRGGAGLPMAASPRTPGRPAPRPTAPGRDREAGGPGSGRSPAGGARRLPKTPGTATGGRRPRVLVLRALGLGDLLAGIPALRALRRGFPGHEVVLAAPAELEPLAAATGAVDRLLPASAPGRAVPGGLDWTGPAPEVAVDLHGNGPPSHRLLADLGPGRLFAFAHPGTPEIEGPPWYAEEHERDRWCRLLRWYGVDADPTDLRLPRPPGPSPAPGAVVLHPGAGSPARRWPVDRFAAVAGTLLARGHRVVVTGGADEGDLVATLAKRAGLPDTDVFGGGLPHDRFSALVAGARAVVSGDTGIAHLAVAHGTPSVTLCGPVPPSRWGPPPDEPRHRALWHGTEGDPHGRRPDPALLRITPEEVVDALDALPGPPPPR